MLARALLGVLALLAFISSAGAKAVVLPGWTTVSTGPDGGAVLTGQIPGRYSPVGRQSAVYLPPGYGSSRRYPVVYLLHGFPGSPSSFYDALRLADVADSMIASKGAPPFLAVMPYGGPLRHSERAEWAGPWERFVVRSVVPWADAHLATIRSRRGRALAGLSAGGFGAMDIGLRHPSVFGTLESWGGYFAPVYRDGPFAHASHTYLRSHDPVEIVRREAPGLRKLGARFYVSTGGSHGAVKRTWTITFARELSTLHLRHELWLLPRSQRKHFWRATFPSALRYAADAFRS